MLPSKLLQEPLATQDNVARPLNVSLFESVADKLATLLQEEVSKLTVGDPFDNADITPVIDNASADFIWGLIEDAQEKKLRLLHQSNVRAIFSGQCF